MIKISHSGSLKRFGYSPNRSQQQRYQALVKAVNAYGKTDVIRKLVAVMNLTANTLPKISAIYHNDYMFVHKL